MSKKSPNPTKKPSLSQVRIIAGEYRRRLVSFIDADGLRPTPDRVRETLFNWLADSLPNSRVLDCCAGSGALGFEAVSRGASHVTLIEANREQFLQLQRTQQQLAIPSNRLTCLHGKAEQLIPQLSPLTPTTLSTIEDNSRNATNRTAFDVIFLDPPYALELWQPILQALSKQGLMDSETLIYIEANQPHADVLGEFSAQLHPIKDKKIGQIYIALYHINDL
ncbi:MULTISPECIES: 16S rRNA (guanine(966)-N(2))-methyltransferase RsmD [unclassified Moraxella]|uniref:16S rRNA (guanine(966)-N(2))-methyltransferase RsmD n=1 Tax=unclassified Moraxella TaxID=2685852 RepID=UPI003AF9F2BB